MGGTRRGITVGKKEFAELLEPFGKISKKFGENFAFIAARTKDAGDCYELRLRGVSHLRKNTG